MKKIANVLLSIYVPPTVVNALPKVSIFVSIQQNRYCYSHFISEETRAQKCYVARPSNK